MTPHIQHQFRWLKLLLGGVASFALSGCLVTPEPLTYADRATEAAHDRLAMYADNAPLSKSLTLREAFSRALANNLDARVKVMEEALAENDLDLSHYDMLPKLAVNGAYTTRDNVDGASSRAVFTGDQSLVPSTSTDRQRFATDLTLSWNVLDFGVSYFNARQQADHLLISEEERRKVVQKLLQDVRRAYWRAAGAQRLNRQIAAAIRDAQSALPAARKVETEGLRSPVDSLRYQKSLLELIGQLETVQHQLDVSKIELASLINLPPGQSYSLSIPPESALHIRTVPMPIAAMEETALVLNPDIRQQSYQKRISVAETRKALLRLLPGLNLSVGPNYDSNSFLVNHFWVAGAARVGGYLSNILEAPVLMRRADETAILADKRREAVSMAVLAKLHIAYQEYLSAGAEYRRATELADVNQRLYLQVANRTATDAQGDLERVSTQAGAVFSELRRYENYADAQAALGRLYASLGLDPSPEHTELLDIATVNQQVQSSLNAHLSDEQASAAAPTAVAAIPAGGAASSEATKP